MMPDLEKLIAALLLITVLVVAFQAMRQTRKGWTGPPRAQLSVPVLAPVRFAPDRRVRA